MNLITITGNQGAGKTTMARAFAEVRALLYGRAGVLEIEGREISNLNGRAFHTIIVEDDYDMDRLKQLRTRLTSNGVLVAIRQVVTE